MPPRLRAPEHRSGNAIAGLGAYRGSRVVATGEIAARLALPEKWITARSGVRTRRWATDDETLASMSVAAAGQALAQAAVAAEDVGCVIVSTISHLRQTPSLAVDVAYRLGAANAGAFDVSAACAGFCYALALAGDLIRAGGARYVLVVGADRLSDLMDHDDPSTAFLFADGAGAVLVGPDDQVGIGPVVWGSDGSRKDMIRQAGSWDTLRENRDGPWPGRLEMSGTAVFRWTIQELVPVARQALDSAGVGVPDLAAFIPHQANGRIVTGIAKALDLPEHVHVAFDVAEQGNSSSASVPLAMSRLVEDGKVEPGGLALLIGFGAGMVHAAQVVRLPAAPRSDGSVIG